MDCCGIILLFLFGLVIGGQSEPVEVECQPGEYLDPEVKVCQNCPRFTFSSTRNQADHCAACNKRCFDNRNAVVVQSCNSTHDTICQCKDGYYALSDRSQCRKHDICPEKCLKYPGTASRNAICYEPCPTSVQELSVEGSTRSTAVVVTYNSTGSLANPNSSLLDMTTTSSSNQTASDYSLHIVLPVLMTVFVLVLAIVLIICYWKKICSCLNLKRAYRQHVPLYEVLPMHGGDQHLHVNHPSPAPRRNSSLAGNDYERSDQGPASLSLESEVPSDRTAEVPLQELEPLHDGSILPDSQQNEGAAQVPNSQILPLESETAGEASSEEAEALLHESQRHGSSSRPSSRPGVLLPEGDYACARLLSGSTGVQDSLTGHDYEDLNDTSNNATSNSEDLRGSQTRPGSEDLQDSPPGPGVQDNRRTSTRPCARVPPLVMMPQRELNVQANNPQHPQVNHPQHLPVNYPGHNQPNNPPDVPNPVVNVESVYSMESMSQDNELT